MSAPGASGWTPYDSLTQAPTNLKEAIDWVLRVTGKDGKKNDKAAAKPPQFGCLCYLAKAIKDLLYDARCPGSPGPSTDRNWDDLLLGQESTIAQPVLQDLGLLSDSTSAASSTCAGGTEVIKALIDHLALGLQKWVGWKDKGDECCLKGTDGIGRECTCSNTGGGAGNCCTPGSGTTCHQCGTCGTSSADNKCYLSAYCKKNSTSGGSGGGGSPEGEYYWPTLSDKPDQVHLLARIFLGSVCLIWSGLSQLGFLTGGSGGNNRWSQDGTLSEVGKGLGSFMAAMGYDLERLNGSGAGGDKTGQFVNGLLTGNGGKDKGVPWQEFKNGDANKDSVAEYYSSIYEKAKEVKDKKTEDICKQYPLLVLHILASGYFRAGSAGANKITPAKPATGDPRKPRHPRTIREILYWLSALPYSQGYCGLVGRMQGKMEGILPKDEQEKGELKLHSEITKASTTLKRNDITHYLMAACGYCPLVLIGIQGTINTSGTDSDTTTQGSNSNGNNQGGSPNQNNGQSNKNKCPKHKEDRNHRCDPKNIKEEQAPKTQANGQELQAGQVCYGGYHLAVKDFGPLHGMYANGLYGFDMDLSAAQCLDQLRIYVYHCFYQLYFLRKQCSTGVVNGGAGKAVLGWQSCRYGSGVYWGSGHSPSNLWKCKTEGPGNGNEHTKKCGVGSSAGGNTTGTQISPLMCFLCDGLGNIACPRTVGRGNIEDYPSIEDHMNMKSPFHPNGHLDVLSKHCPVPMGFQSGTGSDKENHFKDLTTGTHKTEQLQPPGQDKKYPAHCTGNTLSHLLEYYCDPVHCPSGTLVVLLRLLACITPTVPRTLGDLFGFYYYIVYIGGNKGGGGQGVHEKLTEFEKGVRLGMIGIGGGTDVVEALKKYGGNCSGGTQNSNLKCLTDCDTGSGAKYLSPLSGQQYGQLSPLMAGTYLSWLVYLIEKFEEGLGELEKAFKGISCKNDGCDRGQQGTGCGDKCVNGKHGSMCSSSGSDGVCKCPSVVSCTGVLPVLYKYGFGYGDVSKLHTTGGPKKCHDFLETLTKVLEGNHLKTGITANGLHYEINKLIYTTRLPWIFVLTVAWLVAVLYLAFGAIWPLDWTHMRSHWLRGGEHQWQCMWYKVMTGRKGIELVEYFGQCLLVLIVMVL